MLEMIKKQNIDIDTIKIGRGHRNPKIVSDYFLLSSYLIKLLDYEEKDEICGPNRNSYYKTDHDATAMCLNSSFAAFMTGHAVPPSFAQLLAKARQGNASTSGSQKLRLPHFVRSRVGAGHGKRSG